MGMNKVKLPSSLPWCHQSHVVSRVTYEVIELWYNVITQHHGTRYPCEGLCIRAAFSDGYGLGSKAVRNGIVKKNYSVVKAHIEWTINYCRSNLGSRSLKIRKRKVCFRYCCKFSIFWMAFRFKKWPGIMLTEIEQRVVFCLSRSTLKNRSTNPSSKRQPKP